MKTSSTHTSKHGCPLWHVQTVVVRLSRKITVTYRLRAQRRLSQLMAIMLTSISPLAMALPTGAELVAGQATVSTPSANSMLVNQTTNKAILNWQTFNIGSGQSVQFVQPGVSSVALNRVVGNQASSIYGSLTANGQVFLINPAGVMFAPGAQVNVGGLLASSLGISNENFLAGKYTFTGNAGGAVENYGNIRTSSGGYVVLAAPTVMNAGSINANGGSIGLLAGSRVTVDNSGAGLLKFSVDAAAAQAAIVNSGEMTADGGQVAILASAMGDAMATVINQTGVIRANSAVERNGVIVLSGGNNGVVKVAGTIKAAGADDGLSGGSVKILGDKVALLDGTRLDVSGKAGGGTVLVGGNYQGKGAEQNASKTLVSSGAVIDASATNSGNGGKVVVWADDATRFYGAIKAQGGTLAGNGGLVEVSGKQALDLHGSIDVAAPVGIGGKVLLDPQDIVLNATVQASPPNNANGTPDLAFADAPNPGTYTIQVTDVIGYSELFLQASRDITLNSAMAMAAGNSVRLEAGNNITTNAALSVTGAGSINLKADADNSGAGTLALGAALSSQAGGITLSGASVTSTAAGSIATTGAANSDAGQLTITSGGIINLAGAITATGGAAGAGLTGRTGGTVNVNGGGGVTTAGISASGSNGGAGNTAGGNAGSITVANSGSGNITTGALTASTGNAVGTGAGGTAGSIVVNNTAATGNATTGAVTTTGGTKGHGGNIALSALGAFASGNIVSSGGTTISGNAGRNAGTVSITGAGINRGASTITANGSAGLGTSQTGGAGGAVILTSTAGITQTGAITASGAAGSASNGSGGNAGSITVSNTVAGNISLGVLTASTGAAVGTGAGGIVGSVAVTNDATSASLGTGNLSTAGAAGGNGGNITLASQGNVTVTGTLNASGTVLAAGTRAGSNAGNITITAINRSVSGTVTASGSAANGVSQAGGNAGTVSITGTGTLNTAAVTAQSGAATAGGAGGNAGSIILSGSTVTNSGALTTSGGTNGAGGTVNITSQGTIGLNSIAAAFGAGSTVRGDVTLLAGGAITQTGAIVAGNLNATTANAVGSAITLSNAGNDAQNINLQIRDGTVAAVGSNNAAAAITYRDSNAVVVTGINNGIGVGGNLSLTTAGAITQTGAIVAGNTSITAGAANSITLQNAGNDFSGPVAVVSALNVNLADSNDLVLGTSTVSGTLNVNAAGPVTQTGALTVTGLTTLAVGTGNDITLSNAANNFSTVAIASANNASLRDTNALVIGTSTVNNSLALVAGGTITQSGAITATSLNAKTLINAGAAIALNNAGNDVSNVDLRARNATDTANVGGAISYTDASALNVAAAQSTSTVTFIAGDALTQSGAIAASTLTATTRNNAGAAITFDNSSNAVTTANLQVRDLAGTANAAAAIEFTDTNAVVISGINNGSGAGGNVKLTAGGAITQTGTITAANLSAKTLVNAGAAITLNNAGNDVTTLDLSARNVADTANANGAISYRDASNFNIANVATSGALSLQSNGNISQSGAVTAASLAISGTGTGSVNLATQANTIATLNAITAAGGFALNNENTNLIVAGNLNTTNNAVSIATGTGSYTQNANIDIIAGSGPITVSADTIAINANAGNNALSTSGVLTLKANTAGRAMSLAGASAFDLSTAELTALASGATGTIVIGDTASTGVMTIGSAVNLAGKTLTLNAGSITDVGVKTITASNLTLNANGQIGSSNANGIDIAATNLSVNTTGNADTYIRTGAINLGAGSSGSNVGSGTLDILATGAVTQTAGTGNITTGSLNIKTLSAGIANIVLNNSANNVAAINLQARNVADTSNASGAIQYSGSGGFDVATVATAGNAALSAAGVVTQSGAIVAAGLALDGAGGDYTLRHASNAVNTLAANTAAIDYSQTNALIVGTVGAISGISTTGAAKIETTGASANLTLNNAVAAGATGDAIVLKAGSSNAAGVATGGQFINTVGAGGLTASAGRYLVYSGDPGTSTEGVSGYSKRYNSAATFTPGGTANMFMYRIAPTLTITADNTTRVYGQSNPAFTGSASGFIDGDTAASVGVSRSSTAVFNTPVAAGPATITVAAINNENYILALSDGQMAISRAPISNVTGIAANNKIFDGTTSATLNTSNAAYSGIVAGDVLNATASGNFNTPTVGNGKTVNISGITLTGPVADNYILLDDTATTTASILKPAPSPSDLFNTKLSLNAPQVVAASKLKVAEMNALLEKTPTSSGDSDTECEEGNAKIWQAGGSYRLGECKK